MKSIQFFALALVALTVASCSTDDVIDNSDSGKKADVTISLVGEQTRATGAGNATTEIAVTDFVAFVVDGEGDIIGTEYGVSPALTATFTDISTTATEVYVVANTGATALNPGLFDGITTLVGLQDVQGDLGTEADGSTQTKDNLYMHGKGSISYTGANGDGTARVTLKFSAAKIELTVVDNRSTTGVYTYSDHQVTVLNAGAHANFFAATPSTQSTFYTGAAAGLYNNPAAAQLRTYLNDNVVSSTSAAGAYHYYVFGNDVNAYDVATKSPTIITVSSLRTPTAGGTAKRVFYPVHFSSIEDVTITGDGTWGTIAPGNNYAITITLTENGSGVIDPEVPAIKADITVTVETTPWNPITAGKDF